MADSNHYATLSLGSNASIQDIKAKYRKLSLVHHPDRGGDTDKMALLNEAYRVLSNPLLKREYDKKRATSQRPQAHTTSYSDIRQKQTKESPKKTTHTEDVLKNTYSSQSHTTVRQQSTNHRRFWSWFATTAVLVFGFFAYELFSMLQPQATVAATNTSASASHQTPVSSAYQRPAIATNLPSDTSTSADTSVTTSPDTGSITTNTATAPSLPTTSSNSTSQSTSPTSSHTYVKHHRPISQQISDFVQ